MRARSASRGPLSGIIYFSDQYDPDQLAEAIKQHIPGVVTGCSTAGQIGMDGYLKGGVSGVSLASPSLTAMPYLISSLERYEPQVSMIAESIEKMTSSRNDAAFGLLLVDGLSNKEDYLVSELYKSLSNIPFLGGSAGDSMQFKKTFVYYEGRLISNAAVFTLFMTSHPFYAFKHQHYTKSDRRLVVTKAEPESRKVLEINGEPAVQAYAELLNVAVEDLTAEVFCRNPLVLKCGNDYYIRSIASAEEDGSLIFCAAVELGMVLSVGAGHEMVTALEKSLDEIRQGFIEETGEEPAVILGFDCIFRRLEAEQLEIIPEVGKLLGQNNVVGFCTYGEQFNSMHMNQTLTGIALARQG